MSSIQLSKELSIRPSANQIHFRSKGQEVFIPIENQLMEILVLLVQRNGQVVRKEEFIVIIWKGNHQVGQTALTKNIFKLRALLKEHGINAQLKIETIPKKGYRAVLENDRLVQPNTSIKNWTRALIGTLICVLGISLYKTERPTHAKVRVFDFSGVDSNQIIHLKKDGSIKRIKLDTLEGEFIQLED